MRGVRGALAGEGVGVERAYVGGVPVVRCRVQSVLRDRRRRVMPREVSPGEIREILVETKRLLEKGWTQGGMAADGRGIPTSWWGKDAACFCLVGAVQRAVHDRAVQKGIDKYGEFEMVVLATNHLRDALGMTDRRLVWWNDHEGRRKADVIGLVDRGIEALDAEEAER